MLYKVTLPRLLVATAVVALITSLLIPTGPVTERDRSVPLDIALVLRSIANATGYYIADTGSYPQTLGDLNAYPVFRSDGQVEPSGHDPPPIPTRYSPGLALQLSSGQTILQVSELPLESIEYTPEFLKLSESTTVIVAYAPLKGSNRWAVCRALPGSDLQHSDVFIRWVSNEALLKEVESSRRKLEEKRKQSRSRLSRNTV